jgi:hypothetical protein
MEHTKILMKLHQNLVEKFTVLLLEQRSLKLVVGNGLGVYVIGLALTVDCIWVLDDHVQPYIWLDLLDEMRVLQSRNALDGVLFVSERLEEADDSLGDTGLLSPLMDIDRPWVEEEDLGVGELFFLRLFGLRFQGGVDGED